MSDQDRDLRQELLDVIVKESMIAPEKFQPDATLESIGIKSYDMVMVLMGIEEKFGTYISVDADLSEAKTLDDLLAVLIRDIQAGGVPDQPTSAAAASQPEAE